MRRKEGLSTHLTVEDGRATPGPYGDRLSRPLNYEELCPLGLLRMFLVGIISNFPTSFRDYPLWDMNVWVELPQSPMKGGRSWKGRDSFVLWTTDPRSPETPVDGKRRTDGPTTDTDRRRLPGESCCFRSVRPTDPDSPRKTEVH